MKPLTTLIAAGSVLAAFALAQPAQRGYSVIDLGGIGTALGSPRFISANGLIAGAAAANGAMHGVLWYKGHKLDIGTPGLRGPNSAAFGVNDLGQAVGPAETSVPNAEDFCGFSAYGFPSRTACLPFVWQNGMMTPLKTLGGANGAANMINNRGQVVGYAETTISDPGCPVSRFEPVVWDDGGIRRLQTWAGDTLGVAAAINDNGQIVGASGTCAGFNPNSGLYLVENHALLWDRNRTPHDLGNLGGTGGIAGNHACALNNRGQVVGHSELANNTTFHGFLWTEAKGMQDLGPLPEDYASIALGINDGGQVVGASLDASFNPRAILWENGRVTDLNTLVTVNPAALYLLLAESINSSGEIVGLGVTADGLHGFLATPNDHEDSSHSYRRETRPVLTDAARRLLFHRMGIRVP